MKIMKQAVGILLTTFLIFNSLFFINASAETVYVLNLYNTDAQGIVYTLDDTAFTAEVAGPASAADFTKQSITIPDSVTKNSVNYSVTSIGESAFKGIKSMESIDLPDSITVINTDAFDGCEGMKSITIPASVTAISNNAFCWCSKLTNITIPAAVDTIGENAFAWDTALTQITVDAGNANYCDENGILMNKDKTVLLQYPVGNPQNTTLIPATVKEIGNSAFSWCGNITSMTVPANVESIGNFAFSCCTGLKSVTLTAGITSIGESAFNYCTSLTNISFSNTVQRIGENSFKDCTSLTTISIPDSVTGIGRDAFYNTSWYNNRPDGILYAGKVVYGYKGEMPPEFSITVNAGTKGIADYAFYNYNNLTKINIPASVVNIGYGVFFYCDSLAGITVEPNNAFYCSDSSGVLYNKDRTVLLQYPIGSTKTQFTIPDGIQTINERAFYYCSTLKSIAFSSSVINIGESAFEGCIGFVSITLPDNLKTIGFYAFYYCTGLQKVTIPQSVTAIGEDTFAECSLVTLYVYKGSYAQEYAVSQNLAYQLLVDYTISLSGGYATGIMENQSVNDIIRKLDNTVVVKSAAGVTITNEALVSTGTVIYYKGNSYSVVVKGDINGDGKVDAKDYLIVKRAYLETYQLNPIQLKAACSENTALPTSKDYLMIKRHFLGTFNLYA